MDLNDEWKKAKTLCRLSDDEVRMARELGMGPRGLIKNIPNPREKWKAPVGVWIRNLYAKKIKKPIPAPPAKPRLVVSPLEPLPWPEFDELFSGFGPPTRDEIAEQDDLLLRRYREFRLAAEYVAAAFAQFEPVRKVVLFGSVASPLEKEVPRFKRFRRAGQPVFHECKDVDLAVWLADLTILNALQRARGQALNDLFAEHEAGVAHHQVDVFLISPETGSYVGRLCNFGQCPKGKPECLVPDCGRMKFLRQLSGFTFQSSALSSATTVTLFDRSASETPGTLKPLLPPR